jgi:putative chitinase
MAPLLKPASALELLITPTLLHRLGVHDPDLWVTPIIAACAAHEINTPDRIAAFLANVMVETSALSRLVEDLNYSPAGLLKTWPTHFTPATAQALGRTATKPADQRAIAETAYGGRLGNGPPGSGDGWLFRGRGVIQLTGRSNYARFAARIKIGVEELPRLLAAPDTAALSAAQFWQAANCNELADKEDIVAVRLAVNGGSTGLAQVQDYYRNARAELAIP